MFTTNNNFKVFVQNTTAGNNVTGIDLSSIVAGTIVALGNNDIALDNDGQTIVESPNSTTLTDVKFAQKTVNGGLTHFSGGFKVKDIVAMSYKAYTAPVEQISYVGYNGTSGNISAIDYNEYILGTVYLHDDMIWSEQINRKPYLYTTEAGATGYGVANGLASLIANDAYSKVQVDVVNSAAYTSGNGTKSNQESTVVNGSTTVTFETDLGYGSSGALIAVGDYLRIGTPAGIAGTPTTQSPVYKVIATPTATTVTLDRAVTAASGTYEDLTTGTQLEVIPAATANAASWGLKFKGLALDWIAKGIFPYKQVSFRITLKGFGSTSQSTTNATYPNGYYKQVSDLEWFSQFGSDGIRNATVIPIPTGRSETSSSVNYDCWTIKYKGTSESDPIVGASNLTSTIYFFAPNADATYITTNIMTPLATLAGVSIQ